MSLDIDLIETKPVSVADHNITHNLTAMAEELGCYEQLWKPETCGITQASQMIPILAIAIQDMLASPEHYKTFDSDNGWGTYDGFLIFLREYLDSCIEHPKATLRVSR